MFENFRIGQKNRGIPDTILHVEIKSAAEWFAAGLKQRGVEWIATLCGHGLDPLFHAARSNGIRLVDVRNEQTASYMAEAYGRLTRRPGVCASSSGVAVANAMTGVMNAWFDGAPMLYISGFADQDMRGMGCFQDCEQAELVRPVSKFSRIIDSPKRTVQILDEAWEIAGNPEGPGPVHLTFPMDVQRAKVSKLELLHENCLLARNGASEAQLEKALECLRNASHPMIIAGSGAYYRLQSRELMQFAERYSIPVQTPIWDRGVCDEESEAFVGVIGALSCDTTLMSRADCIILAGASIDYRVGYLQMATRVVRVDDGWYRLHRMYEKQVGKSFAGWLHVARQVRTDFTARVTATGELQRSPEQTHAVDLIHALEQSLPQDATLIIDGGSIGQWAHHLMTQRRYPSHWLSCGRSGVVGYGLGAAMAARLANADRAVVLLSGDGAFTFTVAELECAARQKLPFVAIVADDQKWGITHTGHLRHYGTGMSSELGPIRFDLLAESMGAQGIRVENREDIADAIRTAIASKQVTVLHVPIAGGNPSL